MIAITSYLAAQTSAALFDISTRGKVALTGPEARSFLHNLCTNDIKNLPPGGSCEAFLTTAKARIIAHFQVYDVAAENALLLVTEPGQQETLAKTLDHYLISEQVEIADRTSDFGLFRLLGPKAMDIVGNPTTAGDGPVLGHWPLTDFRGVDILSSSAQAEALKERLVAAG